jgi:hypothetical protein
MALAQSPDLVTLQGFVADCIAQYSRRLGWVSTILADATQGPIIAGMLTAMQFAVTDITAITTALQNAVTAMQAQPTDTYLHIGQLCNAILANVNPPDSLWPE